MSGKTTKDDKNQIFKKAKWQGFVNVYLSKSEKEQIRAKKWSAEDSDRFFEGLLAAGYKLSMSWSEIGQFYTVSVTGQYAGRPNAGYCMSLKHSQLTTAVVALWWCLEQAGLEGDWSDRYTTAGANDW